MNEKLKQCIVEMLRMGEDPAVIAQSLEDAQSKMIGLKDWRPNHDMADLYRAYKDADFRP